MGKVTTCYIPHPEFFAPPAEMKLSIVTEDYWQGTLYRDDKEGRAVQVVQELKNVNGFYQYVLQQFSR